MFVRNSSYKPLLSSSTQIGGVAQLVERLTGSQEVRGFESHHLHHILAVQSMYSLECIGFLNTP